MLEIILVSFISVASIGPTHMLAIKEGLKNGIKYFIGILFGGVLVDILYANLALLGFVTFGGYNTFKLILLPIGAIIFSFLAYKQLKGFFSSKSITIKNKEIVIPPIFTGIMMTLPNPFAVIMWATLFSASELKNSFFLVSLIILITGLLWITIEGVLLLGFKKYINDKFIKFIEFITAVLLVHFSIKFGYEFLMVFIRF